MIKVLFVATAAIGAGCAGLGIKSNWKLFTAGLLILGIGLAGSAMLIQSGQ